MVDIVERQPYAALRRARQLVLIDATGHALGPVSEADAKSMLLISGAGVGGTQVEALTALLDAAPALRQQVGEADWVGNRRWDLTFKTGQVLRLPQGPGKSADALMEFAKADGRYRLIGGNVVTFDMRNAPRMYLQVPGRAKAALESRGT